MATTAAMLCLGRQMSIVERPPSRQTFDQSVEEIKATQGTRGWLEQYGGSRSQVDGLETGKHENMGRMEKETLKPPLTVIVADQDVTRILPGSTDWRASDFS